MADLCERLSSSLGVPVIDGVAAAVTRAEALVRVGLKTSKHGDYAAPLPKPYTGMLASLAPTGHPESFPMTQKDRLEILAFLSIGAVLRALLQWEAGS